QRGRRRAAAGGHPDGLRRGDRGGLFLGRLRGGRCGRARGPVPGGRRATHPRLWRRQPLAGHPAAVRGADRDLHGAAGRGRAGVAYRREEPAEALAAVGLDPWTHVAVATHDLDTDRAALKAALPSDAAYVGLLGARRRLAGRLDELEAEGMPTAAIARLHAPI